jgi:hypothetical protein
MFSHYIQIFAHDSRIFSLWVRIFPDEMTTQEGPDTKH